MRLALTTLLSLLTLAIPPANAANEHKSIEVSPLVMELQLEKDDVSTHKIVVRNTNALSYEVTFEAFDVQVDAVTHNVSFLPVESKNNRLKSLAAWVKYEGENKFVIAPGEKYDFVFKINFPAEANPGDYYSSLNFYYKPVGQQQNGNVKIRQSIGSLLLVNLAGEKVAQAASPYSVSPIVLNRQAEETEVSVEVANDTLRFVHVKPVITLKDEKGEIYFQKEGKSKRVFPGEKSLVKQTFPNIYLAADVQLILDYSLFDKQKKTLLYEESMKLEMLKGAPLDVGGLKLILILLGIGLLMILRTLYIKKKRKRKK